MEEMPPSPTRPRRRRPTPNYREEDSEGSSFEHIPTPPESPYEPSESVRRTLDEWGIEITPEVYERMRTPGSRPKTPNPSTSNMSLGNQGGNGNGNDLQRPQDETTEGAVGGNGASGLNTGSNQGGSPPPETNRASTLSVPGLLSTSNPNIFVSEVLARGVDPNDPESTVIPLLDNQGRPVCTELGKILYVSSQPDRKVDPPKKSKEGKITKVALAEAIASAEGYLGIPGSGGARPKTTATTARIDQLQNELKALSLELQKEQEAAYSDQSSTLEGILKRPPSSAQRNRENLFQQGAFRPGKASPHTGQAGTRSWPSWKARDDTPHPHVYKYASYGKRDPLADLQKKGGKKSERGVYRIGLGEHEEIPFPGREEERARNVMAEKRKGMEPHIDVWLTENEDENALRMHMRIKMRDVMAAQAALDEIFDEEFPQDQVEWAVRRVRATLKDAENVYKQAYEELARIISYNDFMRETMAREEFVNLCQDSEVRIEAYFERLKSEEKYIREAKLPQITLAPFYGEGASKYSDYQRWSQQYDDMIGNRPGLGESQKMHYLLNSVKGEAKATVKGFTSGDSLDDALEALYERYGDPQRIVDENLNMIMTLPKLTNRYDNKGLRQMYNTYFTALCALKTHQNIPDEMGSLIVATVMKKLPSHHIELWSLWQGEKTVDDFTRFFRAQVTAVEDSSRSRVEPQGSGQKSGGKQETKKSGGQKQKQKSNYATSGFQSTTCKGQGPDGPDSGDQTVSGNAAGGKQQSKEGPATRTRSNQFQGQKKKEDYGKKENYQKKEDYKKKADHHSDESVKYDCVFCGYNHPPETCPRAKAMSVRERIEKVIAQKACISCLQYKHFVSSCRKRKPCQKRGANNEECQKYHSPLLHGVDIATFLRERMAEARQ